MRCSVKTLCTRSLFATKHFRSASSELSGHRTDYNNKHFIHQHQTIPISSSLSSSSSSSSSLSHSSSFLFGCPPSRFFVRSVDSSVDGKYGNPHRSAYTLDGVTKRFDSGRTLFANLNLSFYDGAKIGVLGVNGCGKSSFLRIIAGVDADYSGKAYSLPGYKIGYLPQEPQLDETKTVIENIMMGIAEKQQLLTDYEAINHSLSDPAADVESLLMKQSQILEQIESQNLWDLSYSIDRAMEALGVPNKACLTSQLSGGEKRRVALCQLLLSSPDILLLDEPTNHLDADSVAWLEQYLSSYKGLVIAITHDRYFLDKVAGYILEIDGGRLYPHKGNYASWLGNRSNRLLTQEKQNHALNKMIQRELQWLHSGQKAQQSKGKARANQLAKLQTEREERKKFKRSEGGNLCIPEGTPLLQETIINVSGLTHWHDDLTPATPILSNVNFRINKHDIVGIIGANGTGKTTLLKLLVGDKSVKQGSIQIAPSVKFGYVNQQRELNENSSVWQEIVGTSEFVLIDQSYSMPARAYVAQFNFSGSDQQKKVANLSGGERNRVMIAKSLREGCNVIVLDEPTNDLDVDTLRLLEDSLEDWNGVALIVSHDRWFLDRVCNKLIVMNKETGGIQVYDGGYSEYEIESKRNSKMAQTTTASLSATSSSPAINQSSNSNGGKKKFKKLQG